MPAAGHGSTLIDKNKNLWYAIRLDLGKTYDVRAIQINFADAAIELPVPGEMRGTTQARYIEEADTVTRYLF